MNPWIQVLGWTLIHFVWQGALIAVVAAIGLGLCRRRSAETRYVIACVALTAMLASVLVTAAVLRMPGSMLTSSRGLVPAFVDSAAAARPEPLDGTTSPSRSPADAVRLTVDAVLPAIVWLWLAGVTVLLARFSGGCWRVHRLRVGTVHSDAPTWQAAGETLAKRLGVTVAFRVVGSRLVAAPTVIGWLRPLILLPVSMLASLPPDQIEALIAHELAHVRRRDYLINLVQTIAEALLFFHPAVWWISSRIRQEREHCCDDAAVRVCGEPAAYAEALTALAAFRLHGAGLPVGAASGSLLNRIRRLIDVPHHEPPAFGAIAAVACGLACAIAVLVLHTSPAAAQPAAASNAATRLVRQTDHFEIHYAPALDLHADRIAGEAERAYDRVSVDLRHNLASKVPILLFQTDAERDQAARETSAEPAGHRLLLTIDGPADRWYGLLTHELTHVFSFDIIPGTATPRWIMEGLAEYERGTWDPDALAKLRDAVRSNTAPSLTTLTQTRWEDGPAVAEALGHAAFDFIESRWGKAGVRQFLLALRQTASSGGDAYQPAFQLTAEEFSREFDRYLRARFSAAAGSPQPDRFDRGATRSIEGAITGLRYPVAAGLACLELVVPAANGDAQRWGIECGDAPAADLITALKPGEQVIITGAPARQPEVRRLALRRLVRPSDGYTWGAQAP